MSQYSTPIGGNQQPLLQRVDGGTSSTAAKVAEVFLTAGHAFEKLGEITLQLNSLPDTRENMKWSDRDIDNLRDAMVRFNRELDAISESVQARTTKHIKVDLKRRALLDESDSGGGGGGVGGMRSASPLGRQRGGAHLTTTTGGGAKRGKAYAAAATPRPKLPMMMPASSSSTSSHRYNFHHHQDTGVDYHQQPDVGPMSSF